MARATRAGSTARAASGLATAATPSDELADFGEPSAASANIPLPRTHEDDDSALPGVPMGPKPFRYVTRRRALHL